MVRDLSGYATYQELSAWSLESILQLRPLLPDVVHQAGLRVDPLNELLHFFPVGTRCFSSSNQFNTTLIWVGAASLASAGLSIRKCWPSGDTS
jgi:hypothetical protein